MNIVLTADAANTPIIVRTGIETSTLPYSPLDENGLPNTTPLSNAKLSTFSLPAGSTLRPIKMEYQNDQEGRLGLLGQNGRAWHTFRVPAT